MSDLRTKQHRAIAALLTLPTTEAAAAAAGVTSKTIRRWLKDDPDFADALATAEAEAVGQAARQIAGGAGQAIAALLAILDDKTAKNQDKISAARAILSHFPQLRLLGSIEAQLERLREEN